MLTSPSQFHLPASMDLSMDPSWPLLLEPSQSCLFLEPSQSSFEDLSFLDDLLNDKLPLPTSDHTSSGPSCSHNSSSTITLAADSSTCTSASAPPPLFLNSFGDLRVLHTVTGGIVAEGHQNLDAFSNYFDKSGVCHDQPPIKYARFGFEADDYHEARMEQWSESHVVSHSEVVSNDRNNNCNGSSSRSGSSYGSSWNAASPPDVSSFVVAAAAAAAVPPAKRHKPIRRDTKDQSNGEGIVIIVETDSFSLHDGYIWRKYGEKQIKNEEHKRSYYRCASNGCKIQKRTQRQSKNKIMFTYLGRHNHHIE